MAFTRGRKSRISSFSHQTECNIFQSEDGGRQRAATDFHFPASRPLRSLLARESVNELSHKAIRRGKRIVQFVGNARGRGGLWHRGSCRIGRVRALRDLRYGSQTVVEGTYLRFVRCEYRVMAGRAMAGENRTGSSGNRGYCARRLARVVDDVLRWLRQPMVWSCEF